MTPDQQAGERMRSGWCNLYLQGWYHRAGKPGTMTVHPGDLYPTKEAALADIDQGAPYIATAFVQWEHNALDEEPMVFPEGCKPVPLSESRRWSFPMDELRARAVAPVLVGMENPEAAMYRFAHEAGMLGVLVEPKNAERVFKQHPSLGAPYGIGEAEAAVQAFNKADNHGPRA